MPGVKTKFTKSFVRKVPYEFKCEHCGQESGIQTAQFTGTAFYTKGGYPAQLKTKERERLITNAAEDLDNRLRKARQDVENSQLYDDLKFKSLCPHCGKHQSWASNHLSHFVMSDILTSLGAGLFGGIAVAVIGTVVLDSFTEDAVMSGFTVGCIGGAILAALNFIFQMKKRYHIYQDGKAVKQKHLPIIYWDNSELTDNGEIQTENA
ncbi:MAG: hypothetical protein Q4F17_08590 [Eubacteriales bacterium]|nr:hypothetical protein [Eubacteriales bacterium]